MKAGGVIKQQIHELQIECEATALPERLYVNINLLELGATINVGQLALPPGVAVLGDPEAIVVECAEPVVVEEEAAPAALAEAEPEVIGRKKEEAEEEE